MYMYMYVQLTQIGGIWPKKKKKKKKKKNAISLEWNVFFLKHDRRKKIEKEKVIIVHYEEVKEDSTLDVPFRLYPLDSTLRHYLKGGLTGEH